MTTKRNKRTNADYVNSHALPVFKIIEALDFEPVSIERIAQRINTHRLPDETLTDDQIKRLLCTAEAANWAKYYENRKWALGWQAVKWIKSLNSVIAEPAKR